jgi:glycine cleavage system H protein
MAGKSNIQDGLKYTKEHEWVRVEGDAAVVGITDHAQHELGDIVFVELPKVGTPVTRAKAFGSIESVKAASDLYSPVTGQVVEVNGALDNAPESVNKDPYGNGWMIKIQLSKPTEVDALMDAAGYMAFLTTL